MVRLPLRLIDVTSLATADARLATFLVVGDGEHVGVVQRRELCFVNVSDFVFAVVFETGVAAGGSYGWQKVVALPLTDVLVHVFALVRLVFAFVDENRHAV